MHCTIFVCHRYASIPQRCSVDTHEDDPSHTIRAAACSELQTFLLLPTRIFKTAAVALGWCSHSKTPEYHEYSIISYLYHMHRAELPKNQTLLKKFRCYWRDWRSWRFLKSLQFRWEKTVQFHEGMFQCEDILCKTFYNQRITQLPITHSIYCLITQHYLQ